MLKKLIQGLKQYIELIFFNTLTFLENYITGNTYFKQLIN